MRRETLDFICQRALAHGLLEFCLKDFRREIAGFKESKPEPKAKRGISWPNHDPKYGCVQCGQPTGSKHKWSNRDICEDCWNVYQKSIAHWVPNQDFANAG